MSTGYIQLQSSAGRQSVPVSRATATVVRQANGQIVFQAELIFDDSGKSQIIPVDTPDKSLSLQPNPTVLPYEVYTITIEAAGYETLVVLNIQAFADNIALQEFNMLPIVASQSVNRSSTLFNVPEHGLFTQSGSSGRTPRQVCEGDWVLTDPIIPRFITVHLGKPDSSAQNVTVPFIDYIKNVGSSEIYPTWPEQSLRANIYCQISLALNRVYTEWYRSRNYKFDITNSTQFDQYYVHGRNIFDNISKIVDEIFNTFVRKIGDRGPFYTEYCNGTTATCPGLSQWGTVTLANQGLSAFQILKRYYGNDIELVISNNIQDISESYPGTPLRLGSTGSSVQTIQRQLTRIRKNYPAIPTIASINGVFESTTDAAVRKFQSVFNLTSDGVVGRATWYKISYPYVAIKKLAELGSEGEQEIGTPPDGVYPGVVLKQGSSGSSVEQMQYYLSVVARFNPAIPTLTVDGIFGPGTTASVTAFQKAYGLTPDGLVGKETWNAIYKQYLSVQDDIAPPAQNYPGQYPGFTLRQGSTGDEVKAAQYYLSIVADYYPSVPKITPDGIFGPATTAAVRAFQQIFSLSVDGIIGRNTWNKLYEVYTDQINNIIPPNTIPGVYPGTVLTIGSQGPSVKEMQYYLSILADFYSNIPKIAYDGKFGTQTRNAVVAFQTQFGLTADGKVGALTWDELYRQFIHVRTVDGAIFATTQVNYPGFPLEPGSSGSNVTIIQYFLNYISEFYDTITPFDITTDYDDNTQLAVSEFQDTFDLPITGIVDKNTWLALYIMFLICLATTNMGRSAVGDGTYPGYVLTLGSVGPIVKDLQFYINTIASAYCVIGYVPENGIYGYETQAAVEEFQIGFGIPVTGFVDRQTWDLIYLTYYNTINNNTQANPDCPNCI